MKELFGWSLDGALDPWSCLKAGPYVIGFNQVPFCLFTENLLREKQEVASNCYFHCDFKWAAGILYVFCLFKYVGIEWHPDHLQKKQKQIENLQA